MKRKDRPALLVRVLTEIGRGHISEVYIHDKHTFIHGETDGRHIRINPAVATCDTVIHETLHRLEPAWSEAYVRRTTTYLLRRMSDEQIQQLYEEYNKIAKRRRKRAKRHRAIIDDYAITATDGGVDGRSNRGRGLHQDSGCDSPRLEIETTPERPRNDERVRSNEGSGGGGTV